MLVPGPDFSLNDPAVAFAMLMASDCRKLKSLSLFWNLFSQSLTTSVIFYPTGTKHFAFFAANYYASFLIYNLLKP